MSKVPPSLPPSTIKNWIRSIKRPTARFATMSAPPVITFGGNSSSVNGSFVNGATSFDVQNAAMQSLGATFTDGVNVGSRPDRKPTHITSTAGAKTGSSAPIRVRFMTDQPEIDFCFLDQQFSQFNLVIDGEMAYRSKAVTFTNTGNYRYIKASFGADVVTYEKAQVSLGSIVGGTGHATGDVITLNGGSGGAGGTPCSVTVTSVSGGVVTSADVKFAGSYTSVPTGTFTQTATTGSGTGFTCAASFFNPVHSTKKMRTWELIYQSPCVFMGIVLPSTGTILPYLANTKIPKLAVIGDSITIGTYLAYGGAHIGCSIAQKLGLWDNLIISGAGGTGWNQANGTAAAWSHANRIADFISYDSDIYLFVGSQNDTAGAALQTAIQTVLNAILAANPRALIVGIGNILGDSTALCTSIEGGFALASDQTRVRFINNHSPQKWILSTDATAWVVSGDTLHLNQSGQDRFAEIAAERVYQAIASMIT